MTEDGQTVFLAHGASKGFSAQCSCVAVSPALHGLSANDNKLTWFACVVSASGNFGGNSEAKLQTDLSGVAATSSLIGYDGVACSNTVVVTQKPSVWDVVEHSRSDRGRVSNLADILGGQPRHISRDRFPPLSKVEDCFQ